MSDTDRLELNRRQLGTMLVLESVSNAIVFGAVQLANLKMKRGADVLVGLGNLLANEIEQFRVEWKIVNTISTMKSMEP